MNIYEDIAKRTQGDIYIGVVGPVRTGKSTFIRKFMETLVLPNIENEFKRDRTRDEIPQSGSGKTIMTVEPKFVPADGVVIQLKDSVSLKVRMVDCVGYIVEGALGHEENGKQRLVSTPWSKDAMTFEEAAEIGTKKVIRDHSTIGVVVITDGSVTGIERGSYIEAEERVIDELKSMNKPFVVILNSLTPKDEKTEILRNELEEKYEVPILPVNVEQMEEPDIENILETVLYDFPLNEIRINISKWVEGLEKNHWIKESIISTLKQCIANLQKIRDIDDIVNGFENLEFLDGVTVENVELGEGVVNIQLSTKQELFYNVLEEKSGFKIEEDSQLLNLVTTLSKVKQEYDKIEVALNDAKNFGYGVVAPSLSELSLEEPEIIKQGKQYGVKLKANAPSLHIIKADISTEVSPIVGSEKQSQELVESLLSEFENDPKKIWESNIFGKSLHELVNEGLQTKLMKMPEDAQEKLQETLERIINEGSGGLICIIL